MNTAITRAGESLIANKQLSGESLNIRRFVLALVPELDLDKPVDRDQKKPPKKEIVHTQELTQAGLLNENQVVYSIQMGSDVGDFDFNWIGLETEQDVLFAVAYLPIQKKIRSKPPLHFGNNLTRNFILVFDGAQALTNVTVEAKTWQHDFTLRLKAMDGRERISNRNLFGAACFFGEGLKLGAFEGKYSLSRGSAFLEGIHVELEEALSVDPPPDWPTKAWLNVTMRLEENAVRAHFSLDWGQDLKPYLEAGVQHYPVPLADLPDAQNIIDLRKVVSEPLVQHFCAREGDYLGLRARATTKTDVGLDKLPNAKSDDPTEKSSEVLATMAALKNLKEAMSDSLVGMVAAFDMEDVPPGWLVRDGRDVSRKKYAKLFSVIGTRYGEGDGENTFNVGDFRGVFIRGLDKDRGLDSSRVLGSLQQGQNLSHTHPNAITNYSHMGENQFDVDSYQPNPDLSSTNTLDHSPNDNGSVSPRGWASSGGEEARPVNIALLICIKH